MPIDGVSTLSLTTEHYNCWVRRIMYKSMICNTCHEIYMLYIQLIFNNTLNFSKLFQHYNHYRRRSIAIMSSNINTFPTTSFGGLTSRIHCRLLKKQPVSANERHLLYSPSQPSHFNYYASISWHHLWNFAHDFKNEVASLC